LFGHKKGAFTGADKEHRGIFSEAGEGTIFLDEVTTIPLSLQAKLLRVIQEREFSPLGSNQVITLSAQLLSASSTSLQQATSDGDFRLDLYYRLAVIKLAIPPLNERGNDILLLADHFLGKFQREYQKAFDGFSSSCKAFMLAYPWQGNVRQLENVIHQIVIVHSGGEVETEMVREAIGEEPNVDDREQNSITKDSTQHIPQEHQVNQTLEELEKSAILAAIENNDGNVNKAASALDVNPSTIYRKLQKWGIKVS